MEKGLPGKANDGLVCLGAFFCFCLCHTERMRTTTPYRKLPGPAHSRRVIKYFDTSFSNASVTAATSWASAIVPCDFYVASDGVTVTAYNNYPLIPSVAGTGYGNVNGTAYALHRLVVRGQVSFGDSTSSLRLVLVEDTQPNGVQATGDQVFLTMNADAKASTHAFLSCAAGSGGRFKLLKDVTFTDLTTGAPVVFRWSIPFKRPLRVLLAGSATSPGVASLSNRNIFLLAHANNSSGLATVHGCARAYYED